MDYRREIDGLRAVAVVPVIFFHAGLELFSGGFVGVDVFFVISGYLITSIILSELRNSTFSLLNFYDRRARRILPALFFVMLVCLPFAWLWLLPSDMMDFSRSLVAVSTFSSNIYFWQSAGYWGIENELKPLLHTWSLAVEEQYYLLFPLFLMFAWRFNARLIVGFFAVLALASLALAQWGADRYPTATFFLLVTRGWELAIGAGVATWLMYRTRASGRLLSAHWVKELLSLAGLALIGYAVFSFDESVPFPGLYALVPTLGTALLIVFASQATVTGRLLGWKPLVGIGLISYSAYLWHLPLFAFVKYRSLLAPEVGVFLALSLVSLLLAFFSWRFVEKPFRNKQTFGQKSIFVCAGLGTSFFLLFGLAGHYFDGWPDRMDRTLQTAIATASVRKTSSNLCVGSNSYPVISASSCTLSDGPDTFAVLMGDSHAIAASAAFKFSFEQSGLGLVSATQRGCPPVRGVYVYESETDRMRCYRHNEMVYRYLAKTASAEYVVLTARWALYSEQTWFDNQEGGVEPQGSLYYEVGQEHEDDQSLFASGYESFANAYTDSVRALLALGKKVVLVYPVPEVGWHVPRYVTSAYLSNANDAFAVQTGSTSYAVFKHRNQIVTTALDQIGVHPNLARVYPGKLLCNKMLENRCVVQKDGVLFYGDDDHLSYAGAELVVKEVMRFIK